MSLNRPARFQVEGELLRRQLRMPFMALGERCFELQAEHRRLSAVESLGRSELRPLRNALDAVDADLQRVQAEIDRFASGLVEISMLCSPELLAVLLEESGRTLSDVEHQLNLLERLCEWGGMLKEISLQLLTSQTHSAAGIRNLVRRILLEVSRDVDADFVFPLPGLSVAGLLGGTLPAEDLPQLGAVLAQGLETARLAGWLSLHAQNLAADIESLVIAACLQDVGLLQLPGDAPQGVLHADVSAALAMAIWELPVSVRTLLATHHEHLDGTGRPRGLTARRLTPAARLLGLSVRMIELWRQTPAAEDQPQNLSALQTAHLGRVLQQLEDEAHRGEWCRHWATLAQRCLRCDLPPREIWLPEEREFERNSLPPALSEFGKRRLRLDAAHEQLAGPQFLQRTSSDRPLRPPLVGEIAEETGGRDPDREKSGHAPPLSSNS